MSHPIHCPRCGAALWSRPLPAGSGHACGTCGGVWLDSAAASHVTQVLCTETLGHADIASRTAAHRLDTSGTIACPICRSWLHRSLVGQTSVEVDYCLAHGTWFDKDELGRVAQSFATARAYGRHGSGALVGGAAAGAAVAGVAVAGTALAASQSHEVRRFAADELDPEDAADALELAVDGGSAALEVGAAVGDAVDVGEVAGGVFEILGGLFEGLG